jgi:uncharacterized repeat protein (TIGR03803 family)
MIKTNYQGTGVQQVFLRWFFSAVAALGLMTAPLRAQPTIYAGPESQTVVTSFTAPFGVTTIGATGFQWYFDNAMIEGATNPTFYVIHAQASNAGTYYVQVTNSSGSSNSSPVILTVTNLPFEAPGMLFTTLASLDRSVSGASPQVGVIQGSDGYLYGTAAAGGTNNAATSTNGTVFKMSTNGDLIWAVGFNYADGYFPVGGLAQAGDGNLYGTTAFGGTDGYGTVFRISTNGVISNLYSFDVGRSTNGGYPEASLCVGTDGYLYGTSSTNSAGDSDGTIFKMSTNGGTPIWSFQLTGSTGDVPLAGLVQGADGGLYGTTSTGGASDAGTIFRITTNEVFSLLYSFTNGDDGADPVAGLVQGDDGQLYGTTSQGGKFDFGTIFKITTNSTPTFTLLATFDGTNGDNAEAGLVQAGDGNFYGTTTSSGLEYALAFNADGTAILEPFFLNPVGYGTIFQLTTNGTLRTLLSFDGNDNGYAPHSTLCRGRDGGLYGTTSQGGTNNLADSGTAFGDGTVFRFGVVPPSLQSAAVTSGTFSFSWNAMPGVPYQAQYKDALDQTNWINFGGLVFGTTNGIASQSDIVSTNKTQFYRVLFQF